MQNTRFLSHYPYTTIRKRKRENFTYDSPWLKTKPHYQGPIENYKSAPTWGERHCRFRGTRNLLGWFDTGQQASEAERARVKLSTTQTQLPDIRTAMIGYYDKYHFLQFSLSQDSINCNENLPIIYQDQS